MTDAVLEVMISDLHAIYFEILSCPLLHFYVQCLDIFMLQRLYALQNLFFLMTYLEVFVQSFKASQRDKLTYY